MNKVERSPSIQRVLGKERRKLHPLGAKASLPTYVEPVLELLEKAHAQLTGEAVAARAGAALKKCVLNMAAATMGDPRDPDSVIGPMARPDLRGRLHDQVQRSVDAGAPLALGERIASDLLDAENCFVNRIVKSDPRLPLAASRRAATCGSCRGGHPGVHQREDGLGEVRWGRLAAPAHTPAHAARTSSSSLW